MGMCAPLNAAYVEMDVSVARHEAYEMHEFYQQGEQKNQRKNG